MADKLITKKIITLTFKDGSVDQVQIIESKGDSWWYDYATVGKECYRITQPRLGNTFRYYEVDIRSVKEKVVEVPEAEALTTEQKAEKVRSPYDFELK